MDYFSKKYNKWFRCLEQNRHLRSKVGIYKFGDYWYRPDKDILLHKDIVEKYIDNCKRISGKHKKDAYCIKRGIEIKN